jgi:hypothetical protein
MIRSPAGFDGGDRIKRYLDYYQPSYGVMMLSAGQFSPALLFAAGEQGAWYDPSDFTTMFQDSAGTTPVTAVEQPVGKILDKSGRGNHATQATPASCPVLSARVNQLTYSEQFDNAAWGKEDLNTTGTPAWVNVGVAPDGTTTADKLIPNTNNAYHNTNRTVTVSSGVAYTASFYAKNDGYGYIRLYDAASGANAVFNLSGAGSYSDLGSATATIAAVDSAGWYRCTLAFTASASCVFSLYPQSTAPMVSFAGDGSSGILVWGADLRVTNDGVGIPVYQRIAAATDYDTNGFPLYLKFDGTDDSLSTGTIDPGAVDKAQVFAGARKLSDAARSMLVEFSAATASNSGSFHLEAPSAAGVNNFYWRSKGTIVADVNATGFAAPTTRVLTGLGDIAGDISRFRVNATQVGETTTNQGTGNFLAYPLYIGRRGGTTFPFNGRLYSLIVRFGANLSDAQIASTETWVNGKTKAY